MNFKKMISISTVLKKAPDLKREKRSKWKRSKWTTTKNFDHLAILLKYQ